jgi:protein SCO1/2
LAITVAAAAVVVRTRLTPPELTGAVLTPAPVAQDFRLQDVNGRWVSLSSLRGKVVILTFLYAHCPDVCPLIADSLHRAYGLLGATADKAAFVAVSVDPNGDTVTAIHHFLIEHHVQGELTYLRGTFAELRPVWAHYYVGSDVKEVNPEAVAAAKPAADRVGHTAIVYVIDPSGKIRTFLSGNFDPRDLVTDVKALATWGQL